MMNAAQHLRGSNAPRLATKAHLLVVEDDGEIRVALKDTLSDCGYRVTVASTAEQALQSLEYQDIDLVLTDLRMPGMNGIELCHHITGDRPGRPVVVMTAFGDVESAVSALRAGASDFVTKPFGLDDLEQVISRVLEERTSRPSVSRLALPDTSPYQFSGLLGSSTAMRGLKRQMAQAAASDYNVLIVGELGTGKNTIARAIHGASARRDHEFVKVDCCAAPRAILESELFGHAGRMAVSGEHDHSGVLELSTNGTLFLQEIGYLPLHLQPRLLHAIQAGSTHSTGSSNEKPFNARVIASSRTDLGRAVRLGELRIDLLRQIDVIRISVPPLRHREQDVIELAESFLREACNETSRPFEFTEAARRLLANYEWPGNVAQLEGAIRCVTSSAVDDRIGVDDLYGLLRSPDHRIAAKDVSIAEVERRHIEAVLNALGWNKVNAARALGIDRATLYRKLSRFNIQGPPAMG